MSGSCRPIRSWWWMLSTEQCRGGTRRIITKNTSCTFRARRRSSGRKRCGTTNRRMAITSRRISWITRSCRARNPGRTTALRTGSRTRAGTSGAERRVAGGLVAAVIPGQSGAEAVLRNGGEVSQPLDPGDHLLFVAGQIAERGPLQHLVDGSLNFAPQRADRTIDVAHAAGLMAGMGVAEVIFEDALPQHVHDVAHDDLVGGTRERVAADI